MTVTLDPARTSSDVTLSNGNLGAQWNGTGFGALSVVTAQPRSTGKWYFEYTGKYRNFPPEFGITNSSARLDSDVGSSGAGVGGPSPGYGLAWGISSQWTFLHRGSVKATDATNAPTPATDETAMFAYDLDNRKLYGGFMGTWLFGGDPSAGSGGFSFPEQDTWMAAITPPFSSVGIVRLTAPNFLFSIPTGFQSLDTPVPTDARGLFHVDM